MKLLKLIFFTFLLVGCSPEEIVAQELREEVIIENAVFKVWYSEVLEQPVKLIYTSTNREKNVDRGNMDFYLEEGVWTSNDADYYNNPWDKGHMAPAGSFTDSWSNLEQTFSLLTLHSLKNLFYLINQSLNIFSELLPKPYFFIVLESNVYLVVINIESFPIRDFIFHLMI